MNISSDNYLPVFLFVSVVVPPLVIRLREFLTPLIQMI